MGEMVGSHLLTTADVTQALDKPAFRQKLEQAVATKLDNFTNKQLGPVITLLPATFHGRFHELIELLRWKFVKKLRSYLASPECNDQLNQFCLTQLNQLLTKDLAQLLTTEQYQLGRQHLDKKLQQWLNSPGVSASVASFIDTQTEQVICSGKSLKELLPPELIAALLQLLDHELPTLLQHFATMLNDPKMRAELEHKARLGIDSFIDSVEGLSAIVSALFDMQKIYARLPEFMDKASDELGKWLDSEQVQSDISAAVHKHLNHWLEQPLPTYLEQLPYEKVTKLKRFLRTQGIRLVQSDSSRGMLLSWLDQGLGTIKDRPLGALLRHVGSDASSKQLAELITTKLLAILQAEAVQQAIDNKLQQTLNYWLTERPLGILATRLPSDARDELNHGLFDQLATLLGKEVPPLVDSLDIRRIVEEKVNSLDIMKVEDLLMGIMKEQFKYINLFGALLGMLIGLLNLLLLHL